MYVFCTEWLAHHLEQLACI